MIRRRATLAAAALLALSAAAGAQHAHTPGMTHGAQGAGAGHAPLHGAAPAALPTEPGQGAFAALAEIVAMLRADPATDWAAVDIDGLRAHLVDMNRLALEAEATAERTPTGLRIAISRAGAGGAAASRMVPAHGPVLAAETGWASSVEVTEEAIFWTVEDAADAPQIQALGFFGLMALGDHHRAHHIALAKGAPLH